MREMTFLYGRARKRAAECKPSPRKSAAALPAELPAQPPQPPKYRQFFKLAICLKAQVCKRRKTATNRRPKSPPPILPTAHSRSSDRRGDHRSQTATAAAEPRNKSPTGKSKRANEAPDIVISIQANQPQQAITPNSRSSHQPNNLPRRISGRRAKSAKDGGRDQRSGKPKETTPAHRAAQDGGRDQPRRISCRPEEPAKRGQRQTCRGDQGSPKNLPRSAARHIRPSTAAEPKNLPQEQRRQTCHPNTLPRSDRAEDGERQRPEEIPTAATCQEIRTTPEARQDQRGQYPTEHGSSAATPASPKSKPRHTPS